MKRKAATQATTNPTHKLRTQVFTIVQRITKKLTTQSVHCLFGTVHTDTHSSMHRKKGTQLFPTSNNGNLCMH